MVRGMGYINVLTASVIYAMFYIWAMNFKVLWQEKRYNINFKFNCNSINVVYLLTCKRCRKQYVVSTVIKFRLSCNQCKSNIKSHGEGKRVFKQEKVIKHFLSQWNSTRYFRSNNWSLRSEWRRKTRGFLGLPYRYNVS